MVFLAAGFRQFHTGFRNLTSMLPLTSGSPSTGCELVEGQALEAGVTSPMLRHQDSFHSRLMCNLQLSGPASAQRSWADKRDLSIIVYNDDRRFRCSDSTLTVPEILSFAFCCAR